MTVLSMSKHDRVQVIRMTGGGTVPAQASGPPSIASGPLQQWAKLEGKDCWAFKTVLYRPSDADVKQAVINRWKQDASADYNERLAKLNHEVEDLRSACRFVNDSSHQTDGIGVPGPS